ncbi:MAG TPA: 4Fe-4S dicluster domain-containing protein [Syntrophobacter fumaroxidans]|nr:4Fe-4S dicluster domain-containing protein [Syntrophobacter fumaroxidans]
MVDEIKARVQELLASGKIKGFLGLREMHGQVGPYLFTDGSDLDGLVAGDRKSPGDSRYPLNRQLMMIAGHYPKETFGVLIRGCDERGLKTLFSSNQLNPEKVVPVGIACPQELADACECMKPFPDEFVAGEPGEGRPFGTVERIESLALDERFELWMAEFAKCIKCYGCRNICPMCYCRECTLESKDFVSIGSLPPESPIFHLTRAVHMAGRCIDCGLCNEACPAGIPVRTLYKKVADIVQQEFNLRPGYDSPNAEQSSSSLGEAARH